MLSGCGGGTSIPSCDSAQIEPTHRKEGTCRRNKQVLVVVNPQHTLKLADVTVRLIRPPTLDDQTYKRSGTIVYIVPLRVHNGTDRPQRFPAPYRRGRTGQLVLQEGSHLYVESLQLERATRGVTPPVFLQQPPIPAGATRDGSVVFAFPRGLKAKPGQILLLVTNFADAGRTKSPERVGVIRFYR
ncbi:MAG TPA: hypothetical protein VGN71_00170 [Solirubrobacteraceae bacterium]|nr:hypothetical protein [Solirubrobacteraceae bacterium]